MLIDTRNGKYQVGEKWKFNSRAGEENATLTVLKVESNAGLGVVVHVRVEGVRIKNTRAPHGISETIAHMPFSEAAIQKSVTELVASDVPLPEFAEGYREWRAAFDDNKAGVFTVTVWEGVDFMETALNQ